MGSEQKERAIATLACRRPPRLIAADPRNSRVYFQAPARCAAHDDFTQMCLCEPLWTPTMPVGLAPTNPNGGGDGVAIQPIAYVFLVPQP